MARRSMRDDAVRAAAEMIADKGLAAISLGDVAAATGIHPTSIYRIFRDKGELFDAVLTDALRHTEALRHDVFHARATVQEKVKMTAYSYVHHSVIGKIDRKLLFRALVDSDMDTLRRIADHRASGIGQFVGFIAELVGEERAWPTYFVITTLATGLMHFQPFHDMLHAGVDRRPEHVANRVLSMAIPDVDWASVRLIIDLQK